MVSADEFGRSLRGIGALLNRRPEGIRAFDVGDEAFWRSFAAITLTLPAYVVSLALVRRDLGLGGAGHWLFEDGGLALLVGLGHVAGLLAFPLLVVAAARRFRLGQRCIVFVIVTNWVQVFASLLLAVPGTLLVLGWETPALATLFTAAFGAVALHLQWFATRVALGVGPGLAAGITGLGFALSSTTGALAALLA